LTDYVNIVLQAVLSENLALAYLLGMCTFLAVSRRLDTAVGLGIAVIAVQTLTVPMNQWLFETLLRPGALSWAGLGHMDLSFLRFLMFIGVIAALVQILELVLEKLTPVLHARLGIFLPLLTVNCAILGGSLFMVQKEYDLLESTAYGFGAGLGWAIAIVAFAAIREQLSYSDVPAGLRGLGLAFVVTGFLSMAFSGFSGLEIGP
jgi:Na+-transporting NADH:ubiquinone oxidoreductase subunit E